MKRKMLTEDEGYALLKEYGIEIPKFQLTQNDDEAARAAGEIGYPVDDVEMMAVGSSRFTVKMGIDQELLDWSDAVKEYYSAERVATIIFYRGGDELGRIEETPEGTLEEDILKITEK